MRERIARDLHDTFLQSVQGLVLRFQAVLARIPEGGERRVHMMDAGTRTGRPGDCEGP